MMRLASIALLCFAHVAAAQQVVPFNVTLHAAAPAEFTCASPTSASLIMWQRADTKTFTNLGCTTAAVNNGDNVCCWGDKHTTARNMTQSASNCPKLQNSVLNGQPVLRFDPANDNWLSVPDLSGFDYGAEVYVVVKITTDPPAGAGETGLFGYQNVSNDTHYPWTDGIIYITFANSVRHTTSNPTPTLTAWRLFNCFSETNDFACRIDAAAFYSSASSTVTHMSTTPYFGRTKSNGAQTIDGDVAEVCLYDSKLSGSDRASLETYFDTRYNLSY